MRNKNTLLNLSSTYDGVIDRLHDAIKDFVLDNGEEMSDYYYNEFGINEEDYGDKVIKVLDLSQIGCNFSVLVSPDQFEYVAIWALYVVRKPDGTECLKYYCFYNEGTQYSDDSEALHDYARFTLAELFHIIETLKRYCYA